MDTTTCDEVADEPWRGEVLSIYVAEYAGVEMHALPAARLVAGVGVADDRYALGHGHYSYMWHPDRQLTLISQEVIDEVSRAIGEPVDGMELRRNIVTRGVPLNSLVGRCFAIGETIVYGGRLNVPCRYLERLIDKKVFEPLLGRSGLNCRILRGGTVRPGDVVRPLRPGEDSTIEAPATEPVEIDGASE
ncbi:MOSC domain-containing protein [Streptomyces sp. NL15-2K]|uniref:MOSC domain-containing protein n=1 Tax=Streptomyces sp. NL15-2K TaxID=376149 RepID=UPI000F56059B|nr:MOSC domain-containing protein [Kutzneria buriramensis]WKX05978.1 MOSC domain-containing protein [Kutzneria buriramensis]WKX15966.1 MOSC domain-containing protein [Kutzneria buriramensis]WKX16441.1 MOSC domain-containing protein [Kutzneria buriramensis]GCB53503.1 MOSC domain protein [Streptomyces sp. NL15-2K]